MESLGKVSMEVQAMPQRLEQPVPREALPPRATCSACKEAQHPAPQELAGNSNLQTNLAIQSKET